MQARQTGKPCRHAMLARHAGMPCWHAMQARPLCIGHAVQPTSLHAMQSCRHAANQSACHAAMQACIGVPHPPATHHIKKYINNAALTASAAAAKYSAGRFSRALYRTSVTRSARPFP
eukprot:366176-Chlamydomonas_euryale.AAC.8